MSGNHFEKQRNINGKSSSTDLSKAVDAIDNMPLDGARHLLKRLVMQKCGAQIDASGTNSDASDEVSGFVNYDDLQKKYNNPNVVKDVDAAIRNALSRYSMPPPSSNQNNSLNNSGSNTNNSRVNSQFGSQKRNVSSVYDTSSGNSGVDEDLLARYNRFLEFEKLERSNNPSKVKKSNDSNNTSTNNSANSTASSSNTVTPKNNNFNPYDNVKMQDDSVVDNVDDNQAFLSKVFGMDIAASGHTYDPITFIGDLLLGGVDVGLYNTSAAIEFDPPKH